MAEDISSAVKRPDASSLALLIRIPDDKRCREVWRLLWVPDRLFWATNEAMLLLIVNIKIS
jgi:hypothetical protein